MAWLHTLILFAGGIFGAFPPSTSTVIEDRFAIEGYTKPELYVIASQFAHELPQYGHLTPTAIMADAQAGSILAARGFLLLSEKKSTSDPLAEVRYQLQIDITDGMVAYRFFDIQLYACHKNSYGRYEIAEKPLSEAEVDGGAWKKKLPMLKAHLQQYALRLHQAMPAPSRLADRN